MRAHSSLSSASLERFCVPPMQWTRKHSKLFDPELSASWNTFTLSKTDFDDNFIALVHKLHVLYRANKLCGSDFEQLGLSFAIPCFTGEYNLVPNGENIPVNIENAGDYFHRVEFEFNRLREVTKENAVIHHNMTTHYEYSNKNNNISKRESDEHSNEWNKCVYRTTARSCPVDIMQEEELEQVREDTEELRQNKDEGEWATLHELDFKRQENNDVLTRKDMHFLDEFQTYAETMLRVPDVSEDAINSLNLRWCIIIPKKNCAILLRPHGNNIFVKVNEFHDYLHEVVRKINEIRTSIQLFNSYPSNKIKDTNNRRITPTSTNMKLSTSSSPTVLLTTEAKSLLIKNNSLPRKEYESNQEINNNTFVVNEKRNESSMTQAKPLLRTTGRGNDTLDIRTQTEIKHSLEQRANAQPLPATAYERSLFSPTHTSGNLFAPPQHLNV